MWHHYAMFPLSAGVKLLLALLIAWSLVWKGIALWKAARNSHKKWFILIFIVNTAGILEIIYILRFRNKNRAINS